MPDRTKNYQLPLPLEEEYYSIAVVNETTEKIDAQLRVNADEAKSLRTDLTSYAEQLTASSPIWSRSPDKFPQRSGKALRS